MTKTWCISDTHFSHSNILKFKRTDGTPLREFSSVEEMDTTIINNWNSVVNDEDRIYHLGDVVMNYKFLPILYRLKGRKCLIKGNHDTAKLSQYHQYFDDVRAYVVKKNKHGGKVILSHVPVHPDCIGPNGINIHGHLHSNLVMLPNGQIDKRYVNVSVEQIKYTPVELNTYL